MCRWMGVLSGISPRLAASVALLLGVVTLVLLGITVATQFPRGLLVTVCVALALAIGWFGSRRRGVELAVAAGVACLLVAGALVLLVARDAWLSIAVVAVAALSLAAANAAFRIHVELPDAPRPAHPVLFYNPRSGGGKAARFDLPTQARARGIEPVELTPGTDLWDLARGAITGGADALAMAGGDGSQAIVAAVAAEHGLPYACIPAGTRNHFALDLGVDRDDVVGALDAFVDGGERQVDLAEVNGRVFVNNVSLGFYASAVARPGYREAKLRTMIATLPETLGRHSHDGRDLRWTGPDGEPERGGVSILVSNDRYRLGRAVGSGTRPRLDDGVLGVAVVALPEGNHRVRPLRQWTTERFDVDGDGPIPAGIDGETVALEGPLQFRIRPHALRVRIARRHPGASPSAFEPDGTWAGARTLVAIAAGRDPRPLPAYAASTLAAAQGPIGSSTS